MNRENDMNSRIQVTIGGVDEEKEENGSPDPYEVHLTVFKVGTFEENEQIFINIFKARLNKEYEKAQASLNTWLSSHCQLVIRSSLAFALTLGVYNLSGLAGENLQAITSTGVMMTMGIYLYRSYAQLIVYRQWAEKFVQAISFSDTNCAEPNIHNCAVELCYRFKESINRLTKESASELANFFAESLISNIDNAKRYEDVVKNMVACAVPHKSAKVFKEKNCLKGKKRLETLKPEDKNWTFFGLIHHSPASGSDAKYYTHTVIPPFLTELKSRGYAACSNFIAGVMPPRAILSRSLL